VLPLAWDVFRSLLPSGLVVSAPSRADFSHLTFGNYSGLIRGGDILHYTLNSLLVAIMTAAATAVIATMAGYGFARFRFRGSGIVFALVLATLMVPFLHPRPDVRGGQGVGPAAGAGLASRAS
jgi:multiple sugar transport system permease protein